jgi:hypothetical protein
LLNLFAAYAGGGMAPGHLPFSGGVADQPACVMRCFDVIGDAHFKLEPQKKKEAE